MNGQSTRLRTHPASTMKPITRSQSVVYSHALRRLPVTANPVSGSTANSMPKIPISFSM